MIKSVTILFLSFVFISGTLYGQIGVGDSALNFNLPDTSGTDFSLDDYAGDIILLNFFATWCVPCQIEAPQLQDSIWTRFKDSGVTILGIDFQELLPPLKTFIQENELTYPVLRDTAGAVFRAHGFTIFPSNVLIDRAGKIVFIEEGFNIPLFIRLIDSLLAVSTTLSSPGADATIPSSFEIKQNHPNPFNNRTLLRFSIAVNSDVVLIIYDLLGRKIYTGRAPFQAGEHNWAVSLEGAASGIYFYSLQADRRIKYGRMVLQQ